MMDCSKMFMSHYQVSVSEEELMQVVGKMFTNCGDLELPTTHARGDII